ncbi:MAG: CocE/NonD family hydrolase [Nitrospiraceae bacterium]
MRTQRFLPAGLVIAALAFPLLAQTPAAAAQEEKGIDLIWGLKIPMRDGVQLNATVYKPKDMREPLPVVFTLTPYVSDAHHRFAYRYAQQGYVSVMVDIRGRGNSGGAFEPRVNESRDGYDVVEWLARQPWSNGKVAMAGGSYRGSSQWRTLKAFPPHLATIVPMMGGMPGPWEWNNIWPSPMKIAWFTGISGVTNNWNLSGEWSFWHQKLRELYLEHRPLREFDKIVGNTSTVWRKWLDHPVPDAFWDAMVPTVDDYKRINIPILTITGHYDGRQRGALEYYRRHMAYGTLEGREKHYVILGPWNHDTGAPEGLKFGEASRLDWSKLIKEWYDWTLKDGPKPEFLRKRVAYYVVGPEAEEWKYADSLEAIASETWTLYLHSDGRANDTFHAGFLREQKPRQSPPDNYVYDPLDVRPAELEPELERGLVTDQRWALNFFGGGLVYHSEPFSEATEITGFLKFVAWMAMDVPDTDFIVNVYEIQPDGTSIGLTLRGDRMRARYRESLRQEKLIKPGEINRYEFNSFRFFSRRIAKGSRLRLVLRSPNSIYWQKNYNSGGVVAEESGKDARTAHITLYHDAEHPSFLELPVAK